MKQIVTAATGYLEGLLPSGKKVLRQREPRKGITYQIVKHALVQRPLPPPTLPELLVVVVQALPVLAELVEAGLVNVFEAVRMGISTMHSRSKFSTESRASARTATADWHNLLPASRPRTPHPPRKRTNRLGGAFQNLHATRTPRDLPSFSQAIHLALAVALVLAVHVVVIVGLAAGADEVTGAEQRGGRSTDLGDLWDMVGEGGSVDEDLLVESGGRRRGMLVMERYSRSGRTAETGKQAVGGAEMVWIAYLGSRALISSDYGTQWQRKG